MDSTRRTVLATRATAAGIVVVSVLGVSLTATIAFSQTAGSQSPSGNGGAEPCSHSPICAWGGGRNSIAHEERTPDMGFTFAYPLALPAGVTGGVAAVAINSKEHLFAFQRNPAGKPQLFEFDQSHKLIHTIGED